MPVEIGGMPHISDNAKTVRLKDSSTEATARQTKWAPTREEMVSGDPDTWTKWVAKRGPDLRSLAARYVGPDSADDMVQETWIKAINGAPAFKNGNPDAWLTRILKNTCLSDLRSGKTAEGDRRVTTVDGEELQTLPANGEKSDPDEITLFSGFRDDMVKSGVDPDRATAVVLKEVGFDYAEIAEAQGTKVGTTRSRIHRGKDDIRAVLGVASQNQEIVSGNGRQFEIVDKGDGQPLVKISGGDTLIDFTQREIKALQSIPKDYAKRTSQVGVAKAMTADNPDGETFTVGQAAKLIANIQAKLAENGLTPISTAKGPGGGLWFDVGTEK